MKKNKVFIFFLLLVFFSFPFISSIQSEGATFTVTNTNDTGAGSLRNAITSANANGIPDTIDFNISGAGVHTIYPQSQLPQLTDNAGVFINGLTQGGADDGANPPSTAILLIEINGAQAGASHGLWIISQNNTIQGIVIDSFQQDGIRIQGNVPETFNNYIYCNFIGTDPSGTQDWGNGTNALSPWAGVNIIVTPGAPNFAHNNTVTKNLSSGNYAEGVAISSCPPGDNHHNIVEYNYLGTDLTGMNDLGNDHNGVYIGEAAHDNLIDSNLISGNNTEGVCIIGYVDGETQWYTQFNTVTRNTIGLNVNHSSPLRNEREGVSIGVYYGNGPPTAWQLGFANYNVIGPNNTIAFNGRSGVMIWEHSTNSANSDNNQITRNSIYDNGPVVSSFLGIDLDDDGLTSNDASDQDSAANQDLNFPVIDSAIHTAGSTTIYGRLNIDTSPAAATIEIFKANPDASGYGEGEIYLGAATPDGAGNWNTTVSGLNPGDSVTATTTDLNLNTSEFSLNYMLPYITVTAPNGGENVQVGSSQNITWNSGGTSGNVHIEFSDDNGSTWYNVIASTPDDGSHTYTIPAMPSDSCLIRISDVSGGNPSDVSDAVFTISTSIGSITVTSPNGGEAWIVDSTYNITWTSSSTSGSVYIEYSANNGSGWSFVTASTSDDGSYSWTVPNTPSTNCLVRITDSDGSPCDTSDAVFTITLAPGVPTEKIPTVYSMTATKTITNKNLELIYTLPDRADVTFSIYDITGKIRKKTTKELRPGFYSEEIDLSGAPAGIYFVKMEANGKEFNNKFLLIK